MAHQPPAGQVAVRWLGQGGFAFRSPGGLVWCVDPFLSSYSGRGVLERLAPTPVRAQEVGTQAVLCTHNHSDHVDPISLPEIAQASPAARFYAATEGAQKMRELGISADRVQEVRAGDRAIRVTGTDAHQTDVAVDVVFASHSGDAVGYVFHVGHVDHLGRARAESGFHPFRVYVTGDTLYDAQLISETTRGVDVLCVCINGRGGNMTHTEAATLAGELEASTVIPMHFGVMPQNTIEPQLFVDALKAQAIQAVPHVLEIGQTLVVGR